MRLAIDVRALTDEYQTGVGLYTKALVTALAQAAPQDDFILFASGTQTTLDRLPVFNAPNLKITEVRQPNRWLSARQILPGSSYLESWLPVKPDAWLLPKFTFFKTQLPYWLTVHDLAFEIFPEFITAKERLYLKLVGAKAAASRAQGLLVPSHSTALDLQTLWGINADRLHVTPLGVTPADMVSDNTNAETQPIRPKPYILALATLEPRKNFESILEAFDNFRRNTSQPHDLVLAGSLGWKSRHLHQLIQRAPFAKDIHYLGYVSEQTKKQLYAQASCFVFPSFYEGFGLPVLEAMSHGVPVITGLTGALPEVIGDAGLLIDPFNVQDLEQALHVLLDQPQSPDLRQHLSQAGRLRAQQFTWEQTAKATLRAIKASQH